MPQGSTVACIVCTPICPKKVTISWLPCLYVGFFLLTYIFVGHTMEMC